MFVWSYSYTVFNQSSHAHIFFGLFPKWQIMHCLGFGDNVDPDTRRNIVFCSQLKVLNVASWISRDQPLYFSCSSWGCRRSDGERSSLRPQSPILQTQRESIRQLEDLSRPCTCTGLLCNTIIPYVRNAKQLIMNLSIWAYWLRGTKLFLNFLGCFWINNPTTGLASLSLGHVPR